MEIPPDKILTPDTITDEQLKNIGPAIVHNVESTYYAFRMQIRAAALGSGGDDNVLREQMRRAKEFQAQLSAWIERLGGLVTERLRDLEHGLGADADTISEALNSDPEQRDAADWWKGQ
jgi:hypothetical protein